MEMGKVEWEQEQGDKRWAGPGRPESDDGDVLGRWEKQKYRWREVDK